MTSHAVPQPPSAARRVVLAAGVVALVVCAGLLFNTLFRGGLQAPFDFTAFWVAGRLAADGENPYDPARVRQLQRDLGMDDTAIVLWNPPWVLSLVIPVGLMPFRAAYGVWVLAHLALVIASAELLWRGFGGEARFRWLAHLVTLTFVPVAFLIGGGQITAVVLVGLAGFLAAARANRPYLAGACAALCAVKPHLLALFALWLLWEATRSAFGRKVLLGGLAVGAVACLLPTLANPHVWADYLHAATSPSSADHHHLSRWTPPLAGWWLRQAVPGNPFWVQWLPLAVGVIAFAAWWRKQRSEFDPAALVPWLVGGSLFIAPYGVWQHDLVLLLVPILAVAAKVVARPNPATIATGIAWFVGVNAVSLAMMLNHASSEWYVWFTPAVLLGCAATLRQLAVHPAATLAPAGA